MSIVNSYKNEDRTWRCWVMLKNFEGKYFIYKNANLWSILGGEVFDNEYLYESASRILRSSLNIGVLNLKLFSTFVIDDVRDIIFIASNIKEDITPGIGMENIRWEEFAFIPNYNLEDLTKSIINTCIRRKLQ